MATTDYNPGENLSRNARIARPSRSLSKTRGHSSGTLQDGRPRNQDTEPPILQVQELRTTVGGRPLHRGVSFSVRRGEILGIIGNSGSGKSLLLKCIMGLLPPQSGTVEIFGRDLYAADEKELHHISSRCGVLFQQNALFSTLTVQENIEVPIRELTGLPERLVSDLARLKISMAGLPPEAADQLPSELSGGMQKRAGLARAIATDPELLLLDEPTTGLDVIMAEQIDALIHDMARLQNITVVLVTHDVDTLFAICDRVAALYDGEIVALCEPNELFENPHPWVKRFLSARPRTRPASGNPRA